MNRVIKFRAWDKKENKMHQKAGIWPTEQPFVFVPKGDKGAGKTVSLEDEHIAKYGQFDYSDVILLQFTGLTDKNGKEIYEGDIVRFKRFHDEDAIDNIDTIDWEWITNMGLSEDRGLRIYEGEIIGNIYENPELIK